MSRKWPDDDETQFLNLDLEILSKASLAPLVKAFGKRVLVLHEGRWGRRHGAFLELSPSGHEENPDVLIRRLAALVRKLPVSARRLWNGAIVKRFDIGVQAGLRPRNFELAIRTETLEAVARIGASIGITVYAAKAR